MAELSAIIVTHNSADEICECLRAAIAACDEVIVVDNASTDDTAARARQFEGVHVIAGRENLGFAGGVNLGVQHARYSTILVMNPDVVLMNHPQPLVTTCHERGYAASAGMLIGEDGVPQRGFAIRRLPTPASLAFEALGLNRVWPRNPVNRRWRAMDLDLFAPQDVEQPAGAFFVFRREVWEALGGFDTRFHPVWFEDVDFCRRLALRGWRIRYLPEVRARHAGGASIRKMRELDREVQWYVSLLRYSAAAFGVFGRLGVAVAVALAAGLRWGWSMLSPHRWSRLPAYPKIGAYALGAATEAVFGRGVRGEVAVSSFDGARASARTKTTDTQPNVP